MKQLTFPQIMDCTLIHPDGKMDRVRFGQYEAIMITEENGWDVDRCRPAIVASKFVTNVTKADGIKVVFDNPWYKQVNPDYE